jgi:hypothetical protein
MAATHLPDEIILLEDTGQVTSWMNGGERSSENKQPFQASFNRFRLSGITRGCSEKSVDAAP